jgi:hypothetical protein
MPYRPVEIPKGNGKFRTLQIPCIRDRVVQGALKRILEAVFEADFCPDSSGFRPQRGSHHALARVRRSVMRRMSTVIDVDLSRYSDTIRHSVLLEKIAKRIQDPQVMGLVKQIIKAGGSVGVPQGGPFRPLAANIYLNELDWLFDAIRRKTACRSIRSDRSAPSSIAHSFLSRLSACAACIRRPVGRIQRVPASSFEQSVFPQLAGTTSSIIHACATAATIDFPARRSFAQAHSASPAHGPATPRSRVAPARRRPESSTLR